MAECDGSGQVWLGSQPYGSLGESYAPCLGCPNCRVEGETPAAEVPTAHANQCPDCGTVDTGHALDPPPFCGHPYECYVAVVVAPVGEAPAGLARLLESAVVTWQVEHGKEDTRPEWFDEARDALLVRAEDELRAERALTPEEAGKVVFASKPWLERLGPDERVHPTLQSAMEKLRNLASSGEVVATESGEGNGDE